MFERSKQISLHLNKILSCPRVCVYYVCALARHSSEIGAFPVQLLQNCDFAVEGDSVISPSTSATQTFRSIHVCICIHRTATFHWCIYFQLASQIPQFMSMRPQDI